MFCVSLSFADEDIYDRMQGAWCTREFYAATLYTDEMTDENGDVVTDDDGNIMYNTLGDYRTFYLLVKNNEIIVFEFLRLGEDNGSLGNDATPEFTYRYQFFPVDEKYLKEQLPNEFNFKEVQGTIAIALLRKDYYSYDRIDKENIKISWVEYDDEYGLKIGEFNLRENFKSEKQLGLPYYLFYSLYKYSIESREDFFATFFNEKVGVYMKKVDEKENNENKIEYNSDDENESEEEKVPVYFVEILEENDTSYHIATLGYINSEIDEHWVPKSDIVLIYDMILK